MKKDVSLIEELSVTAEKASRSLCGAIRYISAVSEGDFYNINVKDLFKISLSDISEPDVLSKLGISPAPLNDDVSKLSELMYFAFAARLPYLRRRLPPKSKLNDRFLFNVYESCVQRGAADSVNVVRESFKRNMKSAKSNQPEPPFNGEWFRRWVYSSGGELAAISNRIMFLLGCMDALLPLFYAKLTDVLASRLEL